ncbi:MAG: BACON domain-containing protein [Odoribacter splanchnicus]
MKRLFYLLMMLSCTLWSCSKSDGSIDGPDDPDNPDTPTNVTLDISVSDLVFEAEGGEKEFTIYCNSDWTITNNSTWCKTDTTAGNGDKTITVTADPYGESEDQNTNLTIKAGDKTKVLTVTQKHGDAIILTKDKFDVPQEGDNITIEVKSNIEYQVTVPTKFQKWIKQGAKSKALEIKNFNFTISANEDFDKREGYIVFNGNSLKDTVYVYQAQKNQLILTENTYNIPAERKDITVELKTNVDYEVTVPDSVSSWVSLIQTKAIRTDKLNFSIAKNESTNSRKAIVIIKDKNSLLTDTLHINQSQKNALILTQKKYDIKAEGKDITVELKTNVDYEVTVPDSVSSWVSLIQTKAIRTDKLNFSIAKNESTDNRKAIIIIKDKNSTLADTLFINQSQKNALILTQKSFVVKGTGEDITVKLQTNVDYEVKIPTHASSWISQLTTKALNTYELRFQIKANDSQQERSAKIVVKDKNSVLSDTIFITQVTPDTYAGDVVLTTLEEVQALQQSGCKKINGNLTIEGKNITSLVQLNNILEEVVGDLVINNSSLKNLDGLYSLKKIGQSLKLYSYGGTNLEGLNNLTSIGENLMLIDTTSSYYLGNLTSFEGLNNLASIGGNFEISASSSSSSNSSSLNALTSFEGLNSLASIGGNFEIRSSSNSASSNPLNALTSFEGLNNLKTINGNFSCNTSLNSTFDNLESVNGKLDLRLKGGVCNFPKLQYVCGDLSLNSYNSSENTLSLPVLKQIKGNFSVVGFSSISYPILETIDGDLNITGVNEMKGEITLKSVGDITIKGGRKLYDFCNWKTFLSSYTGIFVVSGCGYNPTKYQILNGECSKTPEE